MNAPETILITGTVTRLIYSDKGTDFRILEIQPKGAKAREVVTCEWAQARIGAEIEAYGQWRFRKNSQQLQFTAHALTEVVPTGALGLQRWLESGVKGIGKSTAKKLIKQFGADVPDVLDHHPERLAEIGLSENQVNNILRGWKAASASRVILHFLREVGIGPERSSGIWRHFKEDPRFHNDPHLLVAVLRGNPYLLIEVRGVGFSIADQVGGAMGMLTNDTARIQAGILHILQERAERDGHVWATYPEMESAARELLGVSDDLIHEAVNTMLAAESPLVSALMTESSDIADSSIALAPMHYMEKGLAREIRRLAGRKMPSIDIVFPEDCLADEAQASALQTIGASPFCILTGGPGMGKTTLIRAVVDAAQRQHLKVILCAPTGRAAKRMEQATGVPAATIHRTIGLGPDLVAKHGLGCPLDAQWVIVDEASMMDELLAYRLFCAIPSTARLLLVGDPDQLPSVGAGAVLSDLLESQVVPIARLTRIFRQAAHSGIPVLAKTIIEGQKATFDDASGAHFMDMDKISKEQHTEYVVSMTTKASKKLGYRVQVLSPMHSGPLGTVVLNQHLREAFNPDRGQNRAAWLREGDWVIQTRNNYDLEIFNGDLGTVISITEKDNEKTVMVDFEGREVCYKDSEDLRDLEWAYCLTVHKAQGGQFPAVALIATPSHFIMLKRNLLYTGVTRAEERLMFFTTERALQVARKNTGVTKRETMLLAFLEN